MLRGLLRKYLGIYRFFCPTWLETVFKMSFLWYIPVFDMSHYGIQDVPLAGYTIYAKCGHSGLSAWKEGLR